MNQSDFAIVILNWNGSNLLSQFLPSVIKNSNNATIYVIDNASTDHSVELLKNRFPQVKRILLKENLGYAGGYKKGLEQITATYYCLLNSDIEVTPNWLTPILEAFENDDQLSVIQPKILDFNKKSHFEYAGAAGGFIDQLGYPYCQGRIFDSLEEDQKQYDKIKEIFWASGACFFIKSKAFWEVGGFDVDYFAHQEEIDLCWRLQHLNHKISVVPQTTVYHVGGASLNYQNPQKTYLNFRNSLFNLFKNIPGIKFILILFLRMVLDGVAGIQFLLKGQIANLFAILKAHFHFYVSVPKLIKKRKKITHNKIHIPVKSIVLEYFLKGNKKYSDI